ncbi:MAG: DUF4124 domain-containing protein [Pseudomonadales bacterium]|nr:DUF4124 domain-containing protein [Pseudomonadales bacterium]
MPLQTFANGIFKCTDDQGTTTFSFTPCAAPEPETAAEDTDQLTHKFDSHTMRLLSELNSLQAERQRVARL